MATCKSCSAPIVWLPTAEGRSMPVDQATAKPGARQYDTTLGHVAHWTTCPHRQRHGTRVPVYDEEDLRERPPKPEPLPPGLPPKIVALYRLCEQRGFTRADMRTILAYDFGISGNPVDWDAATIEAVRIAIETTTLRRDAFAKVLADAEAVYHAHASGSTAQAS